MFKCQPKNKNGLGMVGIIIIAAIVIIAGAAGYYFLFLNKETVEEVKKKIEEVITPSTAQASKFATYEEVAVDFTPQVEAYKVASDLSNVVNADQFTLFSYNQSAKEKLVKNAFVVTPGFENEFFSLYEKHRYDYTPSFVTADSIMHNYHLLFDHLLRKVEEDYFFTKLKALNQDLLKEAKEYYETLKETDWEEAAKRNVGFFTVGAYLFEETTSIPSYVKTEVQDELSKIEAHEGIAAATVMNIGWTEDTVYMTPQGPLPLEALKEDYSQYVPRGHYDKTEELKKYFKSMMWYGRMTFRLKNEDEIKSALLITLMLGNEENNKNWSNLYEPINFFVGKADDITYYDFNDILIEVYGESVTLNSITTDDSSFETFVSRAKELEPPQINSIPIFQASIQEDREEEIKGFRFMGQRFTIDASIFQRLIYREVGDKNKTCAAFKPEETSCQQGARCLPKGLDVSAAMGSSEALNILKNQGETEYACYEENSQKMKDYISKLDENTWTQNLYWGWLYSLLPLTEEKSTGYPSFMTNKAWVRKDLNSYLGSWTELKHDTILYAKQAYAELGGGPAEQYDDRGYVEPRPYVFARLAALTKMTKEGLEIRNMISNEMKDNLDKMETLALKLKTIAEKELNNQALSDDDYELIRTYGGQLEHFWNEVNKEDMQKQGLSQSDYLNANPAAIVADVATDPNGQALEEAIGRIDSIYVIFPLEGKLKIAKGGVFSYYEFKWPLSDRLTDSKWREMLGTEDEPERPDWTSTFLATD